MNFPFLAVLSEEGFEDPFCWMEVEEDITSDPLEPWNINEALSKLVAQRWRNVMDEELHRLRDKGDTKLRHLPRHQADQDTVCLQDQARGDGVVTFGSYKSRLLATRLGFRFTRGNTILGRCREIMVGEQRGLMTSRGMMAQTLVQWLFSIGSTPKQPSLDNLLVLSFFYSALRVHTP